MTQPLTNPNDPLLPTEGSPFSSTHSFPSAAASDPLAKRARGSLIPLIVGGILIIAAALKALQITEGGFVGSEARWLAPALVQVELLCGVSLFLTRFQSQARWAGVALFACFSVFSAAQTMSGAKSCGCLGNLNPQPGLIFGLDLIILAGLVFWRPEPCRLTCLDFRSIAPLASCLACYPILVCCASTLPYPRLQSNVPIVDLGNVKQGETCEAWFKLRNPHSKAVGIHEVSTSCPCVKFVERTWTIASGTEGDFVLAVRLDEEPDFSGLLLVAITARTAGGDIAFAGKVRINVLPVQNGVIRDT